MLVERTVCRVSDSFYTKEIVKQVEGILRRDGENICACDQPRLGLQLMKDE